MRSSPFGLARGFDIVGEYSDKITGTKAKRAGLDQLMSDARRGRFDVVMVLSFDRMARSVKHFLEILDELNHLNIALISFRENIDTSGPLGRAMIVIVGAIAELERSLIVERVKAGMRPARLEGRQIGRAPLDVDRGQIAIDRRSLSLSQRAASTEFQGPAFAVSRSNRRSRPTQPPAAPPAKSSLHATKAELAGEAAGSPDLRGGVNAGFARTVCAVDRTNAGRSP
jgi:DNA invertase Pin-like site-specific DNA recombinase